MWREEAGERDRRRESVGQRGRGGGKGRSREKKDGKEAGGKEYLS